MTRSEEQLHVGTESVQAGKARLRKYVVTEQQTVTVPVSHEEVRLEREPITEGNVGDALDGPAISEEEHELVLTAERPVVQKEAVPVERVRLDTETVTENQQVTEDVRKEQIELLRAAGHQDAADRLDQEIVGRNVIAGRWTFQIVEDYDDNYYTPFKDAEKRVREELVGGKRHLFEAEMKEERRTHHHNHHEAQPSS